MQIDGTLLLGKTKVAELLSLEDCIVAVEEIFRRQGNGEIPAAGILGVKARSGGLHVKAAFLPGDRPCIVAKLNTNFPNNPTRYDRPTIQGLIALFDATNGSLLAILDSTDITIKRTAAASAVAAKYLARKDASVCTVCGCGKQAGAQIRALQSILPLKKLYLFDVNERAARDLGQELLPGTKVEIEIADNLHRVVHESDVCITCTPAREFFVRREDVSPGTFIAAVGADAEDKQEIDPALLASSKVVTDSLDQCCQIGDLHHAISRGLMQREDVYAELSEIVAGQKPGRTSDDEITIFDSTGVAIEDAAAAAAVYEKARAEQNSSRFNFAA